LDEAKDEIQHLTTDNGKLAQRLGVVVAEKEFAVETLSKLSAKMEELIERNDSLLVLADGAKVGDSVERNGLLSDLTNSRSERSSNGASYSSRVFSLDIPRIKYHDNSSGCYESPRQLEPEESGDEKLSQERNTAGTELICRPDNTRAEEAGVISEPKLIKIPGGEYFGQMNERGEKHGDGKMKYDNGNGFQGQWKNNKREGKGITTYASGNYYDGTWKAGKRHGFGTFFIQKTEDRYRGSWEQGLKSGPGCYEYADGELDVSYYQEDARVGEGVRWSACRRKASRLVNGQVVGEEGGMAVEEAMKRTKEFGFGADALVKMVPVRSRKGH